MKSSFKKKFMRSSFIRSSFTNRSLSVYGATHPQPVNEDVFNLTDSMDQLDDSLRADPETVKEDITMTESSEIIALGLDDDLHEERKTEGSLQQCLLRGLSQVPAIVLIGLFHLMVGIPFGVSYFPVGWSSHGDDGAEDDTGVHGPFPLDGKEALGIRMFLFSTIVGQIVFTLLSGFDNPIGLQMVENVPFCHELAQIVIAHQGYGIDALATLFFMFGFASVVVGVVFYVLGKLELGRIVYYFPTHVLVGCIGGIGLYIAKTGLEVTVNSELSIQVLMEDFHLVGVVLILEVLLRILERVTIGANGKPKYPLLAPIYFCLITPAFYMALWVFRVSVGNAEDAGYFFPSLLEDDAGPGGSCVDGVCSASVGSSSVLTSMFNKHALDIWRVIDFTAISWPAVVESIPTLLALTLFSLIHVPINIPAFAISSNTEANMSKELVAHGYSNMIAGFVGGLQNYMAYTQSVLYHKSGGTGKASGFAVAGLTVVLFFVGPTIASYIPRCMAGTLLLHVGIDLFMEGVYHSFYEKKFDLLEYTGIWLITIIMVTVGMEAAMVAGVIAAISTYVVQSVSYIDPIRGTMTAATLRSSRLNRSRRAQEILDHPQTGRNRIFVVQLQGHLFFGNIANLTDQLHQLVSEKLDTDDEPWILILDFALVLGIDSSASQTLAKLKGTLHSSFHVDLCIFVTGSQDGFPCEFDLSSELSSDDLLAAIPASSENGGTHSSPNEHTPLTKTPPSSDIQKKFSGSKVQTSLDQALIFAENALLARVSTDLVDDGNFTGVIDRDSSSADEKSTAISFLTNLCPGTVSTEQVEELFSYFKREMYKREMFVWKQGAPGDSIKLIVRGRLVAILENEAGTREIVESGHTIGDLGLVLGTARMSSVECVSEEAVLYSLDRESFDKMVEFAPRVARLVDLICVRSLSERVQHVSNRIFETRCLPI